MKMNLTKAASKRLTDGTEEQHMTPTEKRDAYFAAERKCRERGGRYVSVADVDHAIWEIVSNRWK